MQFENKTVTITGGSSGIGRAAALGFAAEGAKVLVGDVNDSGGAETVQLIRDAGGTAEFVHVDVSKSDDVQGMVNAALKHFGGIDIAVNNAGVGGGGLTFFQDVDEAEYDQIMGINTKGVWLCMRYQIPVMLEQGHGVVINVASVAGLVGMPGGAIYSGSKHAVIGMTKSVAGELARKNIRVNAVCPGHTITPMVEALLDARPAVKERILALNPMRRFGKPEEIAAGILFLASEGATFMTGMALEIDGGITSW